MYGHVTGCGICVLAEPIQSRCAVLRYSKLSDAQILARVQDVCDKEQVSDV